MSTTHSIGIERLRTLYAIMAGVPDERVDLSTWRGREWLARESPARTSDRSMLRSNCGTTGCAVGWACAYPEFKRQGLKWDDGVPTFDGYGSWAAVAVFFGLDDDDARQLFHADTFSYDDLHDEDTPQDLNGKRLVLMRIRNYLLGAGAITQERWAELKRREETGTIEFVGQSSLTV